MSWTVACLALALAMMGGPASAADAPSDVYSLDTCPVSGMKLGSMGDAIVKEINGREVRFCCGGCPAKFEADGATYTLKMEVAFAKQQMDVYSDGRLIHNDGCRVRLLTISVSPLPPYSVTMP